MTNKNTEFQPQRISSVLFILCGMTTLVCAGVRLVLEQQQHRPLLDWRFLALVLLTVVVSPQLVLRVPRSHIYLTMGDALTFLTFLLYGGEAAIILTAAEAGVITALLCRRGSIKLSPFVIVPLNISLMAISTAGSYLLWLAAAPFLLTDGAVFTNLVQFKEFVVALGFLTVVQFFCNITIVSFSESITNKTNLWNTWSQKSFHGAIAAVAGGVAAGIVYQAIRFVSAELVVVGAIFGTLIYLTYRRYLAEIERQTRRAEEAESLRREENAAHIAELERGRELFRIQAQHDSLTGLANRAFFLKRVEELFENAAIDRRAGFTIFYLDLNRFKNINDTHGHAAGDELLVQVARRLEQTVRGSDMVARLGGDEFAIALAYLTDAGVAKRFAERIEESLKKPFLIKGETIQSGTSVGIALSNSDYQTADEIVRDADIAMYHAKRNRLGVTLFEGDLRTQALSVIKLETELGQAVAENQFVVYYQPIVSLLAGELEGFEALVRWQHPLRGLVAPLEFIPLAEQTGDIAEITRFVLREACLQLARWHWQLARENRRLYVSVNLSGKNLGEPDLVEFIENVLRETHLPAESLKIELTETAVMEKPAEAVILLERMRSLGVGLAIDDFGTGYSSLSHLHNFPFDTIKIDRSFICNLGSTNKSRERAETALSRRDARIVETIVALADKLEMNCIAEGVETAEHLERLRDLGCTTAQGYLFAAPQPAAAIAPLFKRQSWLLSEVAENSLSAQSFAPDAPPSGEKTAANIIPFESRPMAI